MTEIKTVCGHPRGCIEQDKNGIAHCAWCEEVARLREELERLRGHDGHSHESGDECIGCERLATERGWPYCNQCLLESQLQYCNDFTTDAQNETMRLRELIPDAGMLHRLTYAADNWWEGQGEQAQRDIKAGYALVIRLCTSLQHDPEEAKVARE